MRASCSLVIPWDVLAFLIACPIGVQSKSKSLFLASISSPPILWKSYSYILQRWGFWLNAVKSLVIGYAISDYKKHNYLNHQGVRRKDAEPMNLWDNSQLIGSVFRWKAYLIFVVCTYCGDLFLHFVQPFMKRYCHKHCYDCPVWLLSKRQSTFNRRNWSWSNPNYIWQVPKFRYRTWRSCEIP